MKTMLAIKNSSEKGKSSTTLELANLMKETPDCKIIFPRESLPILIGDFTLVIEINDKIVAFESQGDPGTDIENRLESIITMYNPNLIFCTCRTRGATVTAVEDIAHKYTYDIIWTSTYETNHSQNVVNKLKAEHLQDLVIKLGLI